MSGFVRLRALTSCRVASRSKIAWFLGLVNVLALLQSGCYWLPKFQPPGTIEMQRSQAVMHDPFPNNDVAPAIVGGRPLGFDRPLSEATQNQFNTNRGDRVPPYNGF